MNINSIFITMLILVLAACDNQNNDVAEAYAEDVIDETYSEPITENLEEAITIDEFLLEFEKAVENHDANTLMLMMDKEYLGTQHQGFLDENTTQFLDEFFCGYSENDDEFSCPRLVEINEITPATDYEDNDDSYFIVYYLATEKSTIIFELTVLKIARNGIISFALIGAVG